MSCTANRWLSILVISRNNHEYFELFEYFQSRYNTLAFNSLKDFLLLMNSMLLCHHDTWSSHQNKEDWRKFLCSMSFSVPHVEDHMGIAVLYTSPLSSIPYGDSMSCWCCGPKFNNSFLSHGYFLKERALFRYSELYATIKLFFRRNISCIFNRLVKSLFQLEMKRLLK